MIVSLSDVWLNLGIIKMPVCWVKFVPDASKCDVQIVQLKGFKPQHHRQHDDVDAVYASIANLLLTKSVLHLHSSFVLYNGRALVFTGPSGIGKTTQAELWRDFQGAEIINGDACLLRELEDGWHAFGTPVHGSSPYCENKDAPLAALVALEQGPENRLERLDSFAALSACLPEFYRPKMDEQTQDIFWNAVDSIFRKTPVYRLVCRPDRDATELVKRTVFPAG